MKGTWIAIGVLGGLAGALRVPFAVIPGVQPATALVVVAGLGMGPLVGLGVGALVPLVSNMVLGHGLHTPIQVGAWGAVGLASGLLPRLGRWGLAAWGAVASLAFGLLTDAWLWLLFAEPRTPATLLPLAAAGLPFNIAHAAATATILWWAGPRLQELLSRGRVRLLGRPPRRGFGRLGRPAPRPVEEAGATPTPGPVEASGTDPRAQRSEAAADRSQGVPEKRSHHMH